MSRKKLRPGRSIEVSCDPAHRSLASLGRLGFLSVLIRFRFCQWHVIESERAASERALQKPTMVLSEARGLQLFLVIRGGITCNGGLGASKTGTDALYV